MKVVSFGTLKGGTGKTSVAFNIGGILAEENKVLFIDVDPQSNLSDTVGVDTTDQDGLTIRDVFNDPIKTSAKDVITRIPIWQLENLDIISGHIRMTDTELRLVSAPARERILQRWLERNQKVIGHYDYVIIDTNPSMGIINQNAFLASDSIVLVSDISRKALQGAQLFAYLWGEVCEAMDLPDNVHALVVNNYDKRNKLSRQLMEYYQSDDDFKDIVLNTVIPARVDIKNTEMQYIPINLSAPESDACEAFRTVVAELKQKGVL